MNDTEQLFNRKNWYVLNVKSKNEFKVEYYINQLNSKTIRAFVPSRTEIRQLSGIKKEVRVPLLPSIVLVESNEINRKLAFQVPGTNKYLFFQGKPTLIKNHVINQLVAISCDLNVEYHELETLEKGYTSDLKLYGFEGKGGTVEKKSKTYCWITIEDLGYKLKITYNK